MLIYVAGALQYSANSSNNKQSLITFVNIKYNMEHESNKVREATLYHSQYSASFKYLISFYIYN